MTYLFEWALKWKKNERAEKKSHIKYGKIREKTRTACILFDVTIPTVKTYSPAILLPFSMCVCVYILYTTLAHTCIFIDLPFVCAYLKKKRNKQQRRIHTWNKTVVHSSFHHETNYIRLLASRINYHLW